MAGVVVAATAGTASLPALAGAHGPCGCLEPRLAQAGQAVRVAGSPAYRVVFNPRPEELGIAPGHLASAYLPDASTATVLERPRTAPTRRARFRVPADAPPGLHLVLVFDGEEGGAHNTWEYLHVIDLERAASPSATARTTGREAPAASASAGSLSWPLVALVAAAAFLAGAGTMAAARRRRTGRADR